MAIELLAQVASSGLSDACGDSPGFICEAVWDATGSGAASEIAAWFVERPLKIGIIVVGAVIVNRLVKRTIDRMVERLVASRTAEEDEAESDAMVARLGRRARGRLRSRLNGHASGHSRWEPCCEVSPGRLSISWP